MWQGKLRLSIKFGFMHIKMERVQVFKQNLYMLDRVLSNQIFILNFCMDFQRLKIYP